MATGVRLRRNFLDGVLDGDITDSATSADSPEFADLPEVASPEYLPIVLGNEVVHVTAHTSSATTVTIERAQEGTAAAAHADGTPWEHAPTIKDYDEAYEDLKIVSAAGSTETLDVDDASAFKVTLDADCTFTFAGSVADEVFSFVVWLIQDGTGGWAVTWPASVAWPGGSAPTLTTAAGTISAVMFTTLDGGTTWLGNLVGDDYQ